jgi:glycosyltransferase involved in cell wall biosynthesis
MARIGIIPQVPLSLFRGGAEIQVLKTYEALLRQTKHEIEFVSLDGEKKCYDLLHFFGYCCPSWIRWLSKSTKTVVSPIFFHNKLSHILFFKYFKNLPGTIAWDIERALCQVERILPNSHAEANQISDIFGYDKNKIIVVPNGVEEDFVGTNFSCFRNRYLPAHLKDKDFVLSVHRIEKRKNTLLLMEAIERTDFSLVHIGPFSLTEKDREYICKVKEKASRYPNKFVFLGQLPRNELKNAYASAKVHALISEYETPGLTSLEAGINGANLVVLNSKPVMEYFKNIAWIVNRNVNSIAMGIELAMKSDRNHFSQAEIIKSNYTWRKVASITEMVYDSICL